jgi:hypothetical protein
MWSRKLLAVLDRVRRTDVQGGPLRGADLRERPRGL